MSSKLRAVTEKETVFRPEIEGLRAIAATLVVVFHIWLRRVSGAVDVFFVVSSFLITTGLVNQIERTSQVQFVHFWGRLIKRLLPAALFVLCAVIVTSILLLPKSRWKDTIEEVAAAAVYVENWLLAYKSVDYLAQHEAVSPVQHFWALSVQGQFYVVWPMLIALAAYLARRSQVAFRSVLLGSLGVMFAGSLVYSVAITATNQPFAYFNTFARVWEFCIGALLAVVLPKARLPTSVRVAAGWIGLIAILSCGLVLHVSRVFPGFAALWPTLGAALVITAGTTRNAFGVDRFLSSQPMVSLGGISYSVYLWHFPILVFCRVVTEPMEISFVTGLGILAATLLLAVLTNRLIENPARHSSIGKEMPARALAFGVVCLVPVVIGLALWSLDYYRARHHELTRMVAADRNYPGAMALEAGFQYRGERDVPIYPGPFAVAGDRPHMQGESCNQADDATVPLLCAVGAANSKVTIAVVGGSHSAQWMPALQDIAETSAWKLVTFTKSNCPFFAGVNVEAKKIASCHEWNENVLKDLLRLRPDAVFTTSTRFSDDGELVPEGYVKQWEKLAAAGIRVIAIRDNPDFEFDVSACVELHGASSPACSLPRAQMLAEPSPVQLLKSPPVNVTFIDLGNYFCGRTTCYPVVGNVLIYRHMNHITTTYVRTLAPMLQREIIRALKLEHVRAG